MAYCPDCDFGWDHDKGNYVVCPVCNEPWRERVRTGGVSEND